jgi:SAM-dependent methyltransferase
MSVHEAASSGFGAEAAAYERARPSYPDEAVAWLVDALRITDGATAADVAAGTGKFTRLLVPSGATVLGVEPVAGMREFLAATTPGALAVAGTAEALPFAESSIDGITVAQAFHWFDAPTALREFHRVLKPGGRVGLIWNARDRSASWVDAVWTITDRVERNAPWRHHDDWRDTAFVDQPWFTGFTEQTFRHEQVLTRDDAVDRMRSMSHVAVLAPEEQAAVLDDIRDVLASDPATAGRETVALPYRVDAYWAERL